jgi:two-component system, response regulator YesN
MVALTVSVSLIAAVSIGTLGLRSARRILTRQIHESQAIYVEQTRNALEIVFSQIISYTGQLLSDDTIARFELFPFGREIEAHWGPYTNDELPIVSEYIQAKRGVLDRLSGLLASSKYIKSVYFYDARKNLILSDGDLSSNADEFFDRSWRTHIAAVTYPVTIEPRRLISDLGVEQQLLSIFFQSTNHRENAFVINLSAGSLLSGIIRLRRSSPESSFFIVGRNSEIVLQDDLYELSPLYSRFTGRGEIYASHSVVRDHNGRKYLESVVASEVPDWTYIALAPLDQAYSVVRITRQLITGFSILLGLVLALLGIAGADLLYRPLKKLLILLRPAPNEESTGARSANEMTLLEASIMQSYASNDELKKVVDETLPAYRDRFIAGLCLHMQNDLSEIREKLAYFQINLAVHGLFVSLWQFDEAEFESGTTAGWTLDKIIVRDFVERALSARYEVAVAETDNGNLVLIIHADEQAAPGLVDEISTIQSNLESNHQFKCIIGLGRFASDATELKRSYREASEALRYSIAFDEAGVIYIADVQPPTMQTLSGLREKENALVEVLRTGNEPDCRLMLSEIIDYVRENEGHVHHEQIHLAFMRLLSKIVDLLHEVGVRFSEMQLSEPDLFQEFSGLRTLTEITVWFDHILSSICVAVHDSIGDRNTEIVRQVKSLLHDDIAGATLDRISSSVGLTSNYVSRLFRRTSGMSFQEYVIQQRVERSKHLLVASHKKVREIGTEVGYSNSYYFIRVFRECTGMTPGAYRKSRIQSVPESNCD